MESKKVLETIKKEDIAKGRRNIKYKLPLVDCET
jgi:hypothetical protein